MQALFTVARVYLHYVVTYSFTRPYLQKIEVSLKFHPLKQRIVDRVTVLFQKFASPMTYSFRSKYGDHTIKHFCGLCCGWFMKLPTQAFLGEFILHPWEAIHDVEVAVEVFSKFKKGKLNCRT